MKTSDKKKYFAEYRKKNRDRIYQKKKEWEQKQNSIRDIKNNLDNSEEEERIITPMTEEAKEIPIQEEKPLENKQSEQPEEKPENQDKTKTDFFKNLRDNYKKTETAEETKDEPNKEPPTEHTESVQDEIKPAPSKITPNAETQTLITGYLFLLAVNSVYPDVLIWVLSKASKKFRGIDSDNITLEDDDLEMIEPIADDVVKMYLPKMNPALLLFVCMNAMYIQNIKKEATRKKANKTRI